MGLTDSIKEQWKSGGIIIKLIMVNLAVFVLILIQQILGNLFGVGFLMVSDTGVTYATRYILSTSSDLGELIRRPWSLFTYMFLHEGIWHFFFNMVWLFFAGKLFVSALGARRLLSTYILGGVAGAVLYIVSYNLISTLDPNSSYLLGASASVMAIFLAIATYAPNSPIRLPLIGSVALKYVAAFYVLINFSGLTGPVNVGGTIAHLGGIFYGFAFALQIKKGKNINLWFENVMDKLVGYFKAGTRLKVVYNKKKGPVKSARGMKDEEYNQAKARDRREVDKILDKINKGGYGSLSQKEKDFLNQYSRN